MSPPPSLLLSLSSPFALLLFVAVAPLPEGHVKIKKGRQAFFYLDMPLWEGGHSDKQQKSKRRRQRKKKRRRGRHTSASRVWTDFVRLPIFAKSGLSGCLGLKEQCKCTKTIGQVQKSQPANNTPKHEELKLEKMTNVKSEAPNIHKEGVLKFQKKTI